MPCMFIKTNVGITCILKARIVGKLLTELRFPSCGFYEITVAVSDFFCFSGKVKLKKI